MREILYKAIDKITKKWVEGSLLQSPPFKNGWVDSYIKTKNHLVLGSVSTPTSRFSHVKTETVCQYIGQKDVNGGRVFEGDECVVTGTDFYSNNQFNIEPDCKTWWTLKGVAKLSCFVYVIELIDKSSIPFCDILHDDLSIELTGRNIHDAAKEGGE